VGTATATLALAVATFSSVRSANRSAKTTERALLAGIKPVLMPSRLDDPPEKIGFVDDHWVMVQGGHGVVEVTPDVIYFGVAIRNVGNGLAVLDRWQVQLDRRAEVSAPDDARFHRLTRDIYVPSGDHGFWQGALRDPSDPVFAEVAEATAQGTPIAIDLLYGDHEGGQRMISRFSLLHRPEGQPLAVVSRHWNIDRLDPRADAHDG
jgi:hypothetical protein